MPNSVHLTRYMKYIIARGCIWFALEDKYYKHLLPCPPAHNLTLAESDLVITTRKFIINYKENNDS